MSDTTEQPEAQSTADMPPEFQMGMLQRMSGASHIMLMLSRDPNDEDEKGLVFPIRMDQTSPEKMLELFDEYPVEQSFRDRYMNMYKQIYRMGEKGMILRFTGAIHIWLKRTEEGSDQ